MPSIQAGHESIILAVRVEGREYGQRRKEIRPNSADRKAVRGKHLCHRRLEQHHQPRQYDKRRPPHYCHPSAGGPAGTTM